LAALVLAGAAGPAWAAEPIGRWAADIRHCQESGDTLKTAPLTVTATSLRWLSQHCTFGKMYKAERALYIEGRCQNSAGLMVKQPITLAMKGERLDVTWNGELTQMRRCP